MDLDQLFGGPAGHRRLVHQVRTHGEVGRTGFHTRSRTLSVEKPQEDPAENAEEAIILRRNAAGKCAAEVAEMLAQERACGLPRHLERLFAHPALIGQQQCFLAAEKVHELALARDMVGANF